MAPAPDGKDVTGHATSQRDGKRGKTGLRHDAT
jgi:hypothetical protein